MKMPTKQIRMLEDTHRCQAFQDAVRIAVAKLRSEEKDVRMLHLGAGAGKSPFLYSPSNPLCSALLRPEYAFNPQGFAACFCWANMSYISDLCKSILRSLHAWLRASIILVLNEAIWKTPVFPVIMFKDPNSHLETGLADAGAAWTIPSALVQSATSRWEELAKTEKLMCDGQVFWQWLHYGLGPTMWPQ